MGQDQSKAQQSGGVDVPTITQQEITSSAEFLKDYMFKEKIDSDTQLLQHKTSDQLLAMREFNVTDEAEFKKIYDKFKPKTLLNNQNIVRLFYCLKEKESQLCSTFFKVLVILEYVPNSLEKEVNNRIELKQPFSEDELWNILTQCIVGVNYLYEHSIPHDNIRPSTIYITQKGIVKVADPVLLSQLPLYADTISQLNNIPSGTYLPPELLSAMFNQDYHPVYDQQKSDIFSLGMTVIHAALLQPLDDAYDYKNFTIDEGIVVQRLNKIRENYGQNLYKFLAAMVIMEPAERHDVQFFQSFLNQNSQSFAETPQHYAATQKMLMEKELDLNRQPANPQSQISRRSSQYSSSQQQQQQQSQQYPQQAYQTQAKIMKKEQDDTGNILKFIPQDKEQKMPIPDENPNTNGQGEGFLSTESDHQQEPELPTNLIGKAAYNNNNIPFDNNNNNSTYKATELVNNVNNISNNFVLSQQQQQTPLNNFQQQSQIVKPSYTYSMHPTDPVISSTPVVHNNSNSLIPGQQFPNSNSTTNPQTNNYAFNYQSNTSNPINQSLNSNRNTINHTNIPSNIPINPLLSTQTPPPNGQPSNYTPSSVQTGITQSAPPLPGSSLSQQPQQQGILGSANILSNNNTGSTAYQPISNTAFSSPPISITSEYKHSADIEAILAKYRQPQQQQTSLTAGGQLSSPNGIVTISQNQTLNQLNQGSPSFPPVNNTDMQFNRAYSPAFPSQQANLQQDNGSINQTSTYTNSITNQSGQYSNLEAFKLQQNTNNINGYPYVGNYDINKPFSGINISQKKEFVVESYQNNSKYEGEKLNGMRHGYGKFFYQDGGLFEGEWNQNKMHGKGVLSYASGKPAYDGDWVDDKFEGFGALYNETPAELNQPYDFSDFDNVDEYWTKYEGQFKDDNKEGQGTLYLSNGERFVGGFDKDFVSGQGVFYPKNGQPFHGIWNLNKLVS